MKKGINGGWIWFALFLVGVLLSLVGCSSNKGNTAGVNLWGTEVLTLGGDESDDNEMLYGVADIFSDQDDNIYVVEQGNQRVQVFDREGTFRRTLGKGGQGPGEFMSPIAGTCSQDSVLVADEKTQQVLVFKRESGVFEYSISVGGKPADICLTSRGTFLLGFMAADGTVIHEYGMHGEKRASFGKLDDKYRGLGYFNRICSFVLEGDRLYVCYRYLNLLQEYDLSGKLIRETTTIFQFPKNVGLHQTSSGGFRARPMFWSLFVTEDRFCLVTAITGPIADILKSENYTVLIKKDMDDQLIVENPFRIICGTRMNDGRVALCDMDFVIHVYER